MKVKLSERLLSHGWGGILSGLCDRFAGRSSTLHTGYLSPCRDVAVRGSLTAKKVMEWVQRWMWTWGVIMGGLRGLAGGLWGLAALLLLSGGLGAWGQGEIIAQKCLYFRSSARCLCWKSTIRSHSGCNFNWAAISFTFIFHRIYLRALPLWGQVVDSKWEEDNIHFSKGVASTCWLI